MKLEEMATALSKHCKTTKCDNCQFEDRGECVLSNTRPEKWGLKNVNKRLREAVEGAARVLKEYCVTNGDNCKECFFDTKDGGCALRETFPHRWNTPEE